MSFKWGYQHNCYPPAEWFRKLLVWDLLSNSGNALELLVPSFNLMILSGCCNYSGMVTSQKASEKNVGNRGSKSIILKNINVKEQRVYGSYCILRLRCILVNYQNSSQIKFLSNLIIKRNFSLIVNNFPSVKEKVDHSITSSLSGYSLNPWFISGFTDAEGSFMVKIRKNSKYKLGWYVVPAFSITLYSKDLPLKRFKRAATSGAGGRLLEKVA